MLHRYYMSTLLALIKWLPNVRMIKYAISSLQMKFKSQQPYLNSLCTLILPISYFKYRYYFTSAIGKFTIAVGIAIGSSSTCHIN